MYKHGFRRCTCNPISLTEANKLAIYEDAERQGYIKKCARCGSYLIHTSTSLADTGGFKDPEINYYCEVCGHEW